MTLSLLPTLEDSPAYLPSAALPTAAVILKRIEQRAVDRWGEDKWLANLVREYVRLAIAQGDTKATTVNRRPQIQRAFEVGSCTADTLILLAAAVGCRLQMACTTVQLEEF